MAKIISMNCTPHEIVIFAPEDVEYVAEIRKNVVKNEAKPITVIPKSNVLLNVKVHYEEFDKLNGVPLFRMVVDSIDPVPDEADIVIVSAMYASIAIALNIPGIDRLYTVSQPVYDSVEKPRPIGVLGLNKVI